MLPRHAISLFLRLWCVLGIAFITNACLPIPNSERQSPMLEGVVKNNGLPVKNVQVTVPSGQSCTIGKLVSHTNEHGEFHIDSTSSFELVMWVIGDRGYSWGLCFKFPDGKEVTWGDLRLGGAPELQRLECDISEISKQSKKSKQLKFKTGELEFDLPRFCSVIESR